MAHPFESSRTPKKFVGRGLNLKASRLSRFFSPFAGEGNGRVTAQCAKGRGTEGSNPAPSSGESRANLTPSLLTSGACSAASPDYPGERLVVCKNPLPAEDRARKRAELLAVTENELARIAARVQRARNPLRQAVGALLGRRHMAKHFQISITDDTFSFAQNPLSIAAEAALDGIYVIRTNLPAAQDAAIPRSRRNLPKHNSVSRPRRRFGVN
jgi:hypothetical protein